jgi:hypothetical protein
MGLSVFLVVRDEERFVGECLRRVRPFADEMIVVDTGSRDRTREICRALGAVVYETAWEDDFAKARNFALDHCREDWVLYLDADEWVVSETASCLRHLSPQHDAYFVSIVNMADLEGRRGIDAFESIRIFRRRPEHRFEGAVHEQILPALERTGARIGRLDLVVHHFGYVPEVIEAKGKAGRNLAIFQQRADDTPSGRLHLARELMLAGDWTEAVGRLQALLADSAVEPRSPVSLYAHLSLCECHVQLGQFAELGRVAADGEALFPTQAEFTFYRAAAHAHLGRRKEAVQALLWVLSEPDGIRKLWSRLSLKAEAWTLLGQLLLIGGRRAEALEAVVQGIRAGSPKAVDVFLDIALDQVGVAGVLAGLGTLDLDKPQTAALQEGLLRRHLYAAASRFPDPVPVELEPLRLVAIGRHREALATLAALGENQASRPLELARAVAEAALGEPGMSPVGRYLRADGARPELNHEDVRLLAVLLGQCGEPELLRSLLSRELGPERGAFETEKLLRKLALPLQEVS